VGDAEDKPLSSEERFTGEVVTARHSVIDRA